MKPLVFIMPGNEMIGQPLVNGIQGETGKFILQEFPDGETYIRIISEVQGRDIFILCTLHKPDPKAMQLYFLGNLLRDLKAKTIYLVAPYLAYMRQDKQFNPGEAMTSHYFAKLISSFADRLITIDPHLHRINSLEDIFSIPCQVIHAAPVISSWIKTNFRDALLIGPDIESRQWVSEVAEGADVPYIILNKIRHGDHHVEISSPEIGNFQDRIPILVDDIISTGQTMIQTASQLKKLGMEQPICLAVHAVFSGSAYMDLIYSGIRKVVTCNTIVHESNAIDITQILIERIREQ